MRSEELLAKASEIVGGQRAKDYGPKLINHERIAALWNIWLKTSEEGVRKEDIFIDAYDVAVMMLLVKVARLINSPGHTDSHIDIAGYAAVMEEVWEDQDEKLAAVDQIFKDIIAQAEAEK